MKLVITPELRKAIKTAIEADRTAKLQALQNLSLLSTPLNEIQAAREAVDKADEQAKSASKLLVATEADFNVTTGQSSWGERPDNRPVGWRSGWAFRIKSRSGGPDHEIVGSVSEMGSDKWSCNCEGSRFGEKCWAVRAIGGPYGPKTRYHQGGSVVTDEKGVNHEVKRLSAPGTEPDFGLIKE